METGPNGETGASVAKHVVKEYTQDNELAQTQLLKMVARAVKV